MERREKNGRTRRANARFELDLCKESGLSKRSPRACRPGSSRPKQAAARCKKLPVWSPCHAGAGDGWLWLRWMVRLSVPF
jgi:hypothetical protein